MHRYLPDLAGRAVPRYTSYPTAAEFTDAVGASDADAGIAAIRRGDAVSLYLHIPYCHAICWYCGCNTGAIGRADRLQHYVDALLAEIERAGPRCAGRIVSVHFGGGSPNALTPLQLASIGQALRARFDFAPDAEWAAEIDPRSFTPAHAHAFAAIGVRRISVGAQTFAPHVQRAIGRVQPFGVVRRAIGFARDAGIARINLDLMYGLPGQGLDDIAETVARARTLSPDRVAMFGYAHLPRLLPRQRMIDDDALPDAQSRFWQSALAHDLLVEQGMVAIGFDHFAAPGDSLAVAAEAGRLRRNFQGFTDDPATVLIGLGASAISQFGTAIVQNEKHVGRYRMLAANGVSPAVRGVRRDGDDLLRGAAIERLLCDGAIDLDTLPFRIRPDERRWIELVDAGIVTRSGSRVAITRTGRPYARLAAVLFDRHRAAGPARFSKAV
ncbi:oxygen-independent coproporphyrinogen III oxidase [Sphingomonas sp.]|uniref:oxygen-independent coproporphyrinogen III oxidase n=1 Tax=Sphingomonas sp. TaxID=28214 RepID=UPI001ECB2942|nr:oxygen-independent coproporphyrinogen III oxidase [Sphingomonas sp.]MBX3593361.1 oxygen-independent coproporphyrinogen III oxidase [Sphingomonas sp.]